MSFDALSDEHPFILELSSLRNAVSHYQRETYNVSLNLQRHVLESANVVQQLQAAQHENAYLRKELAIYRSTEPGGSYGEDVRETIQVQELTLALRRLSDKLDFAEQALETCKGELALTCKDRDVARHSTDMAYATAVRLRGELESCRAGERDLLNRARAAEEERKMLDITIEEYANLVRTLEGRHDLQQGSTDRKEINRISSDSLDGLSTARAGLQKLLSESNSDSQRLQMEIARLHAALENAQATLEAEHKVAADERRRLAQTELELHRLKADDNAAAKMVSRYMKFSQSSSDILHKAIETMKTKHRATINSYESRIQHTEDKIQAEQRQCERLRQSLDELIENISRETYGRRREIALRLALIGREEMLSEGLKRWLLKAREELRKCTPSDPPDVLHAKFASTVQTADSLVQTVSGDKSARASSIDVRREQISDLSVDSIARIVSAQSAVAALNLELQEETDRRLFLERQFARLHPDALHPRELVDKSVSAHLSDEQDGYNLVHAGVWHQHAGEKSDVPPIQHIKEVNNSAMYEGGRSPEESPNQAELLDMPVVGTHHSQDELFAETSAPSRELFDAGKASIAPYSGLLIKSDDSTSSIVFPGVSPINDNGLAEPSAPERKAVTPIDDSTKSTHDPDTTMMQDISQPSIAALNSETEPPPSLEESQPQGFSCSDSRDEAHAGRPEPVAMEAMVDQSLSHPSDSTLPEEPNSAHTEESIVPLIKAHEDNVDVHDDTSPENNLPAAEPLLVCNLDQKIAMALALEDRPTGVDSGPDTSGHQDSSVLSPADVSERGSMPAEDTSVATEREGSSVSVRDTAPVVSSKKDGSPPLQTEHYRDSDTFPSLSLTDNGETVDGSRRLRPEDMMNDSAHSTLLSRLEEAAHRYDDLQLSFRDCHLSLQQLKQASKELPRIPALYQAAIERLDDYCEDARVELEIRIADEERISRGYQTILSVKGAFSGEVDEADVRRRIDAFVDGSDPAVHKALTFLQHKLDDLQHDIASVKQAMYYPSSLDTSPETPGLPDTPRLPSSSWMAWTGSILSPSRSPSPAPPATFGAVMTSPRLRHSSSFVRNRADSNAAQNTLANLDLRVAMPTQIQQLPSPAASLNKGTPRPRVSSNMFSLGLAGGIIPGSRRTSMTNMHMFDNVSKPTLIDSSSYDDDLD